MAKYPPTVDKFNSDEDVLVVKFRLSKKLIMRVWIANQLLKLVARLIGVNNVEFIDMEVKNGSDS